MCAHFLSSSVSWSFLLRDPEAGVFLKYGLVVPVVVETGVSVTFPLKRLDLLRVTGELADSPLAGVAALIVRKFLRGEAHQKALPESEERPDGFTPPTHHHSRAHTILPVSLNIVLFSTSSYFSFYIKISVPFGDKNYVTSFNNFYHSRN